MLCGIYMYCRPAVCVLNFLLLILHQCLGKCAEYVITTGTQCSLFYKNKLHCILLRIWHYSTINSTLSYMGLVLVMMPNNCRCWWWFCSLEPSIHLKMFLALLEDAIESWSCSKLLNRAKRIVSCRKCIYFIITM